MNHSSSEPKASRSAARLFVTLFLICVLLLGAGGIAFVWLAIHPKHLVSGTIRIAPTEQNLWDPEPKPFDREAYAISVQTQAFVLSSDPAVLSKIVDDLAARGLTFFSPTKAPASTAGPLQSPDAILRQALADGVINIAPVQNSVLLAVTMVSENAEEAKTIVNSFLRNYVTHYSALCTSLNAQNFTDLERHQSELQRRILEGRAQLRALMQQQGATEPDSNPAANLEVQDRQSRIKLDEEFYEKVRRRLYEMEMERDRPRRVSIAAPAEVKGLVDHRGRWTLIVLGATVALSVILLIGRWATRSRS